MAVLYDVLRKLGVDYSSTASTTPRSVEQPWTSGRAFQPENGAVYEVDFGRVVVQGREVEATARLRIEGPSPQQWIDLDDEKPLSNDLAKFSVKRFRRVQGQ
jgi:hypothetical protein